HRDVCAIWTCDEREPQWAAIFRNHDWRLHCVQDAHSEDPTIFRSANDGEENRRHPLTTVAALYGSRRFTLRPRGGPSQPWSPSCSLTPNAPTPSSVKASGTTTSARAP